jgi:hypothetical protein
LQPDDHSADPVDRGRRNRLHSHQVNVAAKFDVAGMMGPLILRKPAGRSSGLRPPHLIH